MKRGKEIFKRDGKSKCPYCEKVRVLWKWTGCAERTGEIKSFLICKGCYAKIEDKIWKRQLQEMEGFAARMENDPYMGMRAAEAKWDSDHSECHRGANTRFDKKYV